MIIKYISSQKNQVLDSLLLILFYSKNCIKNKNIKKSINILRQKRV